MSAITIRKYDKSQAASWDEFVRGSKNGTFLFERGFMEYHEDRFIDHSLIVERDGQIIALLPACSREGSLISHAGLTYGGFITSPKTRLEDMLDMFDVLLEMAKGAGFKNLIYKPVPQIYHRLAAEEDLYALFRAGGRTVRVDASSAIRLSNRVALSKSKRQGVNAARKAGVEVRASEDWASCWEILSAVLADRHDTKPIHSLDEIRLLASRFPRQIRLFGAFLGTTMIAALVVFDCATTTHVQYMASTATGRELGGIDIIVYHLLTQACPDTEWFDFGISTENQGRTLNSGLARQKEMFGARAVIYQQIEVTI